MLEVVIPGVRHGEAIINSSTAYKGTFCYIAGINADGEQLMQLPYDSSQAAKALYPVNKYVFDEFLADTSDAVDKLTNGDLIVYYEGGEYITDRFDQASIGLDAVYWDDVEGNLSTVEGRKLYVPGSSTAAGTTGLDRLYVSTGDSTGTHGYLTADPATIPLTGSLAFVAIAVGVFYTDSSDAKLRFRLHPGAQNVHQVIA